MPDVKDYAGQIILSLRDAGHQAYLVGGCVRDLLLGREPADYDVTSDATPDEVMRIFPETYAVGAQFGVVLVPVRDAGGNSVEVATFRSDIGYSDGRHPDQVRFSKSAQEDVERRDFTINGLLLDPVGDEVLDFVGGRKDLAAGIIRTIGRAELRFAEDKLDETGLLREILPEISAMKGVQQPPEFHPEGDVFVHTLLLLQELPHPCPPTLAWGALLHDVGKPPTFRVAPDRIRFDNHVDVGVKMAEEICRRLRFSNDATEQILALVGNHMRFAHVTQMKESTFKKFVRIPHFDEHIELHRLDCQASHCDLTSYNFTRERIAAIPPESIRPAPLVSGDDLIAAGYSPGPRFKEILSLVEDAQLEGRLQSKDSAMEYVRREFPQQSDYSGQN